MIIHQIAEAELPGVQECFLFVFSAGVFLLGPAQDGDWWMGKVSPRSKDSSTWQQTEDAFSLLDGLLLTVEKLDIAMIIFFSLFLIHCFLE